MSFFSFLIKAVTEFLFPKTRRVIELEALSASELIELLPRNINEPDGATAIFDYSNSIVKEIVWEVKYNGNQVLAEKLGGILYDTILLELNDLNIFEKFESVVLMPVPISDKRRYERGRNQTELLAIAIKRLDQAHQFKYLPRQLAKLRHTESQTKTSNKTERRENLKDSMKVLNPETVAEKCVVLIDDVTTTGSTFTEAKRALHQAGAKKIFCFAVTH